MQLRDFLAVAASVQPDEFQGFAHLAQLYWEARTEGRRGLTQEDVEEHQVEFLIELFTFDVGYGVYVHHEIETLLQGKAKSITDDAFEAFWSKYPRKIAKANARKSWRRLVKTSELASKVIWALVAQIRHHEWGKRERLKFVPHAATWLNQERWEDELPASDPVDARDPMAGVV